MQFIQGHAVNIDGVMVPAMGFEHAGMFIVNPYASDCGRFHCAPSAYGLTTTEALELARLNAGRELLAYWDI